MASERVTLYRTNESKTEVIEQYPKTLVEQVYDGQNDKFLNDTLNDFSQQLAQVEVRYTQRELLAKAAQKLARRQNLTIICQGDSLTYGHDVVSSDRIVATGSADNGTMHTSARAATTYPMALKEYLDMTYKTSNNIINKGFSGDWAEASYRRWINNNNADIAFIMLGTNDSDMGASWVPANIKGDIEKYLQDMRKIIDRFTTWGTAVVLLTSPRTRDQELLVGGRGTDVYRKALYKLESEYGCPIVDTQDFFTNIDNSYYSDSIHLNSKGYRYFAARLMSIFISNFNKSPKLLSGNAVSIRVTRDGILTNNTTISNSSSSYGATEASPNNGLMAQINEAGELYYTFEAVQDNLILLPIYSFENASTGRIEINLDYGNEQPSITLLNQVYATPTTRFKPAHIISNNVTSLDVSMINKDNVNRYLHITTKGKHTVRVKNDGSGRIYFNGFVVLDYETFNARTSNSHIAQTVIFSGETTNGIHTYNTNEQISVLDTKNRIAHVTINLDVTVDSNTSGAPARIRLSELPAAKIGTAVTISYIDNFYDDNAPIFAYLERNGSIVLQKMVNGRISAINGTEIAGKRIKISLNTSYLY